MKVRFLGEAEGLTKGSEYEIVGFGDSIVALVDDDGALQRHTYGKINNRSLWEPVAQKAEPAKAAAAKPAVESTSKET